MKRFIIPLIILLIGIDITAQYKIELEIKGAANMNAQLAFYQSDRQLVVQNGKFDQKARLTFKGDKNLQHGIYFVVVGKDFCDILIRNEQHFKLKGDTSNLALSMKVTGSKENKIFFEYQREVFKLKMKIKELEEKIANAKNDSIKIAEYNSDIEKVTSKIQQVPDKFEKQYPKSYIVKILNAMSANLDEFDFADPELLLTPFYYNKVRLFIKKSIDKNYRYINFEIQKLLNSIKHQKYNYNYVATYLLNFYNTFYKVGINRVFVFIADNYFLPDKAYWFNAEQLKQIKERRDFLSQAVPDKTAPDLTLESIGGEYFSLSQTGAIQTLLYFWSANCGHCTKTTKILKDNYDYFKSKGIEVFAVNIDDTKQKAVDKINELQTNWINCFDPMGESNYRDKYYVYGSPLIYVINQKNKITDMANGEIEIEDLVKKLLKNK